MHNAQAQAIHNEQDAWSEWILHHRNADDPIFGEIVRAEIERHADRVLDGAHLRSGMTLVDIGSGDGLVAFRAFERIGSALHVILVDISQPLLRHAEAIATERGLRAQCEFVHCMSAQDVSIDNACVDALTSRAALAYMPDKPAALREFHRVLKSGGRLSIAEPVFQDEAFAARALRQVAMSQPPDVGESFLNLLHRWKAAQFPDTAEKMADSPICNFSERDLLRMVQEAGFSEIHLELHIDVRPSIMTTWETFIGISPHPWAPTLKTILAQQFSAEERALFEQALRPLVDSRQAMTTDRVVYLTAKK